MKYNLFALHDIPHRMRNQQYKLSRRFPSAGWEWGRAAQRAAVDELLHICGTVVVPQVCFLYLGTTGF